MRKALQTKRQREYYQMRQTHKCCCGHCPCPRCEENPSHIVIRTIWLRINELAILLTPNEEANIMGQQRKDQTVVLGIQAVDAAGNVVPFTPDAPPNWVNNNPASDPGVISPDGLTD